MASALNRAFRITGPALMAGAMALAPSFANAQSAGGPALKPVPANVNPAPANGDASGLKWVQEPIGGPKSDKVLRVADARGMGETVAALLALETSLKHSVILVVQGSNQKVIDDARLQLSMLILHNGYDRVGLIIGDGLADTAYIYSKGFKVETLTNVVKAEDRDIGFENDVKKIYERDVLPELNAAAPAPHGQ